MNKQLDDYLCKKYPKLFVERSKTVYESCMGRGFECADGWVPLIDSLCHSIQWHIDNPRTVLAKTFGNFIKWPLVWLCRKMRWYKILPDLHYVNVNIPQVVVLQVKEKMSGLRFYYQGGDDEICGMIKLAEAMSYSICEDCGEFSNKVSQNKKGWIKSLCPRCMKKYMKKWLENTFQWKPDKKSIPK